MISPTTMTPSEAKRKEKLAIIAADPKAFFAHVVGIPVDHAFFGMVDNPNIQPVNHAVAFHQARAAAALRQSQTTAASQQSQIMVVANQSQGTQPGTQALVTLDDIVNNAKASAEASIEASTASCMAVSR